MKWASSLWTLDAFSRVGGPLNEIPDQRTIWFFSLSLSVVFIVWHKRRADPSLSLIIVLQLVPRVSTFYWRLKIAPQSKLNLIQWGFYDPTCSCSKSSRCWDRLAALVWWLQQKTHGQEIVCSDPRTGIFRLINFVLNCFKNYSKTKKSSRLGIVEIWFGFIAWYTRNFFNITLPP